MIENDKNQQTNKKKEELNNSFLNFINYITNEYPQYENFFNNKKTLSPYLNYSNQIIKNLFNEKILKTKISKTNKRNIQYLLTKIRKINNNKSQNWKFKNSKVLSNKIISQIFIVFNFNLFVHLLFFKKNNDIKDKKEFISEINKILNNVFSLIWKIYIDEIINDDIFELIIKIQLIFSTTKSEKEPTSKDEIVHFIFFKSCINLIKEVFNYIILKHNKCTQKQENMINNIILLIQDNLLNYNDKPNRISYINKTFLSRYQESTSLLMHFFFVLSKIK